MPELIRSSTPLAGSGGSPISRLPIEAFRRVLSHLDSPLDLFRASLVNHQWRDAAIDSKLWEVHYWSFYRAQLVVQTDEDRLLLDRRTHIRRNAMRAWVAGNTSAAPASPLGPLATMMPNGKFLLYEPLEKGLLMVYHMQKFKGIIETAHRLNKIVVELYGDKGPTDLDAAAERLVKILVQETGKQPTVEDIEFAEEAYKDKRERAESFALPEKEATYPHFLAGKKGEEGEAKPYPDFHVIFISRMNEDERLMRDLRTHAGLDAKTLASAFDMLNRYGDRARDLLIAICADQQITSQSVEKFAASPGAGGSDSKKDWPHALDIHMRAASGRSQPRLGHCLTLDFTARQMLGHLQRREAVRSMEQLRGRFQSHPPQAQTLRERIIQCCVGVEEAMEDLALFHFGERAEMREYLGLLALYVSKDIEARARAEGRKPLEAEPPNEYQDPTAHRFPSFSTRHHLGLIERSLRRLGFATALEETGVADEFDNCYLNTSLFCPAQRTTSPIIMLVILCAVARRLGIAATPVNSPSYAMAVVLEDGEKPEDWYGVDSDWGKFYWMPSRNGKFCLHEGTAMMSELAKMPPGPRSSTAAQAQKNPKLLLEPATPLEILARAAEEMLRDVQQGKRQASPPVAGAQAGAAPHHDPLDMIRSRIVTPFEQLSCLRDYLWGRSGHLPLPLPPPILPASLAILPATRAGFPRVNPPELKELTEYAAHWAIRFADPDRAGGTQRIEMHMFEKIHSMPNIACDSMLIFLVNGMDPKAEIDRARRNVQRAEEDGSFLGMGDVTTTEEGGLWKDLGGNGGNRADERREKELLNPAHPVNAAVEHGVGTVFKHSKLGWRGVVYGWDAKYQASAAKKQGVDVDSSPPSGRKGPHYYCYAEDGTRHYVPQSSIEVARVPAGSNTEQATALLREYVQLFTLRDVARCFRTIQVAPWKRGNSNKKGAAGSGSGKVKMVPNAWMRKARPFD